MSRLPEALHRPEPVSLRWQEQLFALARLPPQKPGEGLALDVDGCAGRLGAARPLASRRSAEVLQAEAQAKARSSLTGVAVLVGLLAATPLGL